MSQAKSRTKLVKPLPKGQITLPIEFRRRLKIADKTILSITLKGSKIEILPLRPVPREENMREYNQDEIDAFLKEDRLDSKTAGKIRRLLRKTG